ncbi:uncharacterized protein NECHADRAFT_79929 [Fusarium vanettenii 77-13-4]|uniref:Protein kinase domain-containing protein n=1 Tax=Fusarium vanettenii (strain ATCC MYA-4622 / CBS 123669 / FGSC 9596 / NRRL 45880 / 77-13-4) TaxID=660122 RepID=C7Z0L0_FUSV7|nr:uncharacterized protein NECHADRAFT_79929 [Fusarium vanettenii 77-13-4]EEU42400.1 predicted protein [Fusarium vanettenii 77-13-4]
MSSEDSTDEFIRKFQDSRRGQPSHLPAFDPLPNDADMNRRRDVFSRSSGDSSHVFDYGRSLQSDRTATLPLTAQDTDLVGIGGAGNTLHQRSKLGDLLSRAMLEGQSKRWLPESELLRLCQPDNILGELTATFDHKEAMRFFHYICGHPLDDAQAERPAVKIFVVLLLINELKELKRFVDHGYCDNDLPFTWHTWGANRRILCPRNQPFSRAQHIEHEACFKEGEDRFMDNFYREQWQVHIPFISRTKNNQVVEYELHHHTIMPWTFVEGVGQQSGYSNVSMIKIHPAHHSFGGDGTFALKILHSTDPEDLKRELYAIRKITTGSHVIELLATFKRGSELSFLFPWAAGGNLADLMKEAPSNLLPLSTPNPSDVLARWLFEECFGIARGLRGIHEVEPKVRDGDDFDKEEWAKKYGIHGDLKPENILRFLDDGLGNLKLSDFGLTKFHSKASRSNQPGDGPMSPTYASPEQRHDCFLVSRRSDVWALGCVFSMLLTWAIRGPKALEAYGKARHDEKDPGRRGNWYLDTFYGTQHTEDGHPLIPEGFFLKKAVTDCIEKNKEAILGPDRECNYLTQFLDFIRNRMLETRSDKRATSEDVSPITGVPVIIYSTRRHTLSMPFGESRSNWGSIQLDMDECNFNTYIKGKCLIMLILLFGSFYPDSILLQRGTQNELPTETRDSVYIKALDWYRVVTGQEHDVDPAKDDVCEDHNLDDVGTLRRILGGRGSVRGHEKEGDEEGKNEDDIGLGQTGSTSQLEGSHDEDGGPLEVYAESDAESVDIWLALEGAWACRISSKGG